MSKFACAAAALVCLLIPVRAVAQTDRPRPPGANSPKIFVLHDDGSITIFRGARQTEISGRHTGMRSTVGIVRQKLGDLVVSNREVDGRPGSIVTLPAGKGDVEAKFIIKCKGMTPWGTGLDADSNIWMTDYESNDVREYAAAANGCPAPLATISGPHTGLNQPENVAIDRKGRIVVANYLSGIVIFAPGANGDATPVASLTNAQVMNAHLEGMAVDAKNNIWVTSYANNAVLEFAPDANGTAAPIRVISGDKTQLSAPVGIALDRDSGEIYVAAYGTRAMLVRGGCQGKRGARPAIRHRLLPLRRDGEIAPVRGLRISLRPF
jgi:DNA-binding beta-propeller fold protein YncE